MKFTDSPVIELPVGGEVLRIEQDNGSMHVGTSVWPCSLVLVKFVEHCLTSTAAEISSVPTNPYAQILQFDNKRGVELGTGCGVAGMGLALLGLDVVLTDIAPVLPALKRNVKKNTAATSLKNAGKPGCSAGRVKISQLYWNNEKQIQGTLFGDAVDLYLHLSVHVMGQSSVHGNRRPLVLNASLFSLNMIQWRNKNSLMTLHSCTAVFIIFLMVPCISSVWSMQ